ncbi:DVU_1553 family AMP-dependent CoA ligase [Cohaesibacter haloalkalitolerans]|uniref:DVU_1553 family AMP-dependent CoA ligase n=1 Tax=Cohaesibacter haloalkalitolerans TaxID=1162980 RepID=UPI000E6508C6|nr:HAD hydrolase-like protein [Cohaesibacter haloalkalitolerans]
MLNIILQSEGAMIDVRGFCPFETLEERDAYQLDHMRQTIRHARANSPFYRQFAHWPEDLPQSLEDLADLPFTWPEDLARNDPPLMAAPRRRVARMVTLESSGTTGAPKRMAFSDEDLENTIDYFHRGMSQFARPGDRVGIAFPAVRSGSIGQGLCEATRRLGATPLTAPDVSSADALLGWLRTEQPDVLFGIPVPFFAAARLSLSDGGLVPHPRAILISADHAARAVITGLETMWHTKVFNHWGMTETGYGGALECVCHDGLHVRESDLYLEIIDPLSGAVLPAGARGEITITTLRRETLPLIRYRTGDLGCLIDEPCACGNVTRRLYGPDDRLNTALKLPGGGMLTRGALDEALFATSGVTDYAAVLTSDGRGRVELQLNVAAVPIAKNDSLAESVLVQLHSLPAFMHATEKGHLTIRLQRADILLLPHKSKRVPVCHDNGAGPKAVLFDLDGTLAHTLPAVHAALNEARAVVGRPPVSETLVASCLGGGARRLIRRISEQSGEAPDNEEQQAQLDHYLSCYQRHEDRLARLYPDVMPVLEALSGQSCRLVVVTNKRQNDAEALVKRLGLAPLTEAVFGRQKTLSPKPRPDLLMMACRHLELDARDCLFVGDGPEDLSAAERLTMPALLIDRGNIKREILPWIDETSGNEERRVIESLNDLKAYLKD